MSAQFWIKQKNAKHNSIAVMQNLLHCMNVDVTNQTIEDLLQENPNYPSLASLSDCLSDLRIDNLPVRLDPEDLKEVTFPAIAHLESMPGFDEKLAQPKLSETEESDDNTNFVMVSEVNDSHVKYIHTKKGWISESKDIFLQKWSGIMLLAEKRADSGDPDYQKTALFEKLQKLRLPVVFTLSGILILSIIITGILVQGNTFQWLPLLITKIAGTAICILLLMQLVDRNNTIVSKICNLGSESSHKKKAEGNSGCGEGVLDSKAATLFGWLSMSEVGAFYFIGGVLSIVIGLLSNTLTSILYILITLNIFTLPYTFFSIYYQATKAKKWCKLCVAVQVFIWLEFIAGASLWDAFPGFLNWHTLTAVAWAFILPIIVWSVLKTGLGKDQQIRAFRKQLNIYRRNPAIIKDLLMKGRKVDMKVMPQEVILGNSEASISVTIYSNPFCKPCQYAHQQLDRLLSEFGDEVRVVFRFNYEGNSVTVEEQVEQLRTQMERTVDQTMLTELKKHFGETPQDWHKVISEAEAEIEKNNQVALRFLSLAHLGKTEILHNAMTEWYNIEDKSESAIESWHNKYPIDPNLMEQMKPALRAHNDWAMTAKVPGTPSIFVNDISIKNGVEFIPDLKYYIRAMEDEAEETINSDRGINVIQPA